MRARLDDSPITRVLDLARWAPSGDNTQVWRFEIQAPDCCIVHGRWISDHCVYDLEGHSSELAIGALLENIALAATREGCRARIERLPANARQPTFRVRLEADAGTTPDPLVDVIEKRSVQRRSYSTQSIPAEIRERLEAALLEGYQVQWFEGWRERLDIALLMFRNAGVRLVMPEAYEEHRKVIAWDSRFSEDRIPDQALAIDPLLRRIMKWAMQRWERVRFLNRYAAGTWLARIEMDLIPAIRSGAHFVLHADTPPRSSDDYIAAGRILQRFWLTATRCGLQLQPETTPLIFASYLRDDIRFCEDPAIRRRAQRCHRHLKRVLHPESDESAFFFGRLGFGQAARARSLRRPLDKLLE